MPLAIHAGSNPQTLVIVTLHPNIRRGVWKAKKYFHPKTEFTSYSLPPDNYYFWARIIKPATLKQSRWSCRFVYGLELNHQRSPGFSVLSLIRNWILCLSLLIWHKEEQRVQFCFSVFPPPFNSIVFCFKRYRDVSKSGWFFLDYT